VPAGPAGADSSFGLVRHPADADEAVADLAEGGVVSGLAGALLVVVAAGAWGGPQDRERLASAVLPELADLTP
jgi:hypothetical protein